METVFSIEYYTNYDKQISSEETFLDFNAAYLYFTSLKAYVLHFIERRGDGTVITYTTNRRSEFKGRVFCHPIGLSSEEIEVHKKPD